MWGPIEAGLRCPCVLSVPVSVLDPTILVSLRQGSKSPRENMQVSPLLKNNKGFGVLTVLSGVQIRAVLSTDPDASLRPSLFQPTVWILALCALYSRVLSVGNPAIVYDGFGNCKSERDGWCDLPSWGGFACFSFLSGNGACENPGGYLLELLGPLELHRCSMVCV